MVLAAELIWYTMPSNTAATCCQLIYRRCMVVNIYLHFRIHTTRVEKLKTMCLGTERIKYKQLLGYAKTRFLALGPSIGRVLNIFDVLREYFLKESQESAIKSFFENSASRLYLMFVYEQVSTYIVTKKNHFQL